MVVPLIAVAGDILHCQTMLGSRVGVGIVIGIAIVVVTGVEVVMAVHTDAKSCCGHF